MTDYVNGVDSPTDKTRHSPGQSSRRKNACLLSLTKKGGNFLCQLLPGNHYMAGAGSVSALVQRMVSDLQAEITNKPPATTITEPRHLLECPACDGFTSKPVCLPCGHSVCKSCLEKPSERAKDHGTCSCCKALFPKVPYGFQKPRCSTLLLQNISEKWYPTLSECCTLREEGNRLANENKPLEAIAQYTKALERAGPIDHRILGNRSKVFLDSGSFDSALEDAETCCSLKPCWSKGHYRRGVALQRAGQLREAAAALLLCAHFGYGDLPVLKLLHSVLSAILKDWSSTREDLGMGVVCVAKQQFDTYLTRHHQLSPSPPLTIPDSHMDVRDFECVLCTSLLYKPVTVPCGHTFCQGCLARTFDHTPYCPMCRSPLGETFRQHTVSSGKILVDAVLEGLLQLCFPEQYRDKEALVQQDLLNGSRIGLSDDQAIPIFVCTLGYPGIPCPLHIFEPRYRLMMRRCTEGSNSSRRFGMCLPIDDKGISYTDVGTVLFISSLEYTPDGRSLVTTLGERRFRVLERGSSDGYAVARIRFLSDQPVEGEENIVKLRALQQSVYNHAMRWFNALPVMTRMTVIQNVCLPPPPIDPTPEVCPNAPSWVWWFVNVVPTSHDTKLAFLSSQSLQDKLYMLREVLPLPTVAS